MTSVDWQAIRKDFPILEQEFRGKPLVYLDSGATTQRPNQVTQSMIDFDQNRNSNVHRGVSTLSQQATDDFEASRGKVQQFINANSTDEIVFTKGTTESINLVASSLGEQLQPGDEIILSTMEHHSNIIPWQRLAELKGVKIKVAPINAQGEIFLDAYKGLFTAKTKIVALAHVSNVLGTINPVAEMIATAKEHGALVLLDGAQAAPHMPVDVQALDCDFYVFSAHKMYGPTGVGVLYGKRDILESMAPYQTGGGMISQVSFDKTIYAPIPAKFEAGTPNIAGVVGMGAAIDYVTAIGLENIANYENSLLIYATEALTSIEGLEIMGTSPHKAGVLSFTMKGVHAHDIGTILDSYAVAVRAGHHCAMPLMVRFQVAATVRASLGIYNNREDIDRLVEGLEEVKRLFG